MEVYVIPFQGMMPTLFANDHVVVNKLAYGLRAPFFSSHLVQWSEPSRGDVIVFRSPFDKNSLSIRRVVGLPGDRVFFENGNLYVNEQLIKKSKPLRRKKDFSWLRDEDFSDRGATESRSHYAYWEEKLSDKSYSILLKKQRKGYLIFGPYQVPAGHYFVMGDNRDNSQDSRTWPARIQKARGKVRFSRPDTGPPILIPKGTLVRTGGGKEENDHWPEYFETEEDRELQGQFVEVGVRAKKAGLTGNVQAGEIQIIEGSLSEWLSVSNIEVLRGGEDQNMVADQDIFGRVYLVWFSCLKTLSFLSFICDPTHMRWNRVFLSI